jgi:RNA recognition motif-containing protein
MVIMNILVSNLSSNIIADDLISLFSVYGDVSFVAVVRDKKSGRSKGNAFLEMPHEAQGEQAILALNHSLLDGVEMLVQEIIYKPGEFNN